MNPVYAWALARNPFFAVSKHGLWLGCDDPAERLGYTCIAYFDTYTIGL